MHPSRGFKTIISHGVGLLFQQATQVGLQNALFPHALGQGDSLIQS